MMSITKQFMTAGRAVFTLECPSEFISASNCKPHYTFRVVEKNFDRCRYPLLLAYMLTGPNNESDFSYCGMIDRRDGHLIRTDKSPAGIENSIPWKLLNRVGMRVWKDEVDAIEAAGFSLHHEGRCGRCSRPLTTPESVRLGIGPDCLEKMSR